MGMAGASSFAFNGLGKFMNGPVVGNAPQPLQGGQVDEGTDKKAFDFKKMSSPFSKLK